MTGRVIVGVLWLAMVMIVAAAWSAGVMRAERQGRAAPASISEITPQTRPNVGDRLDLYGNTVEDAVGDYRLDFDGELYERHAPQIEVSRLSGPSL